MVIRVVEQMEIVERSPTKLVLREQAKIFFKIILLCWGFGFIGAALLPVVAIPKTGQQTFLLSLLMFAVIVIVFSTLLLAFRTTTYIFDKELNAVTIRQQLLLTISEKQYLLTDVQAFGIEEYSHEAYYDTNGDVYRTSHSAILKLPEKKVVISYSRKSVELIHSPVVQSVCAFLNLPLKQL